MSYGIGIDVGTTFSAAAVSRGGRVVAVELSGHGASVPSVLFFGADGSVQVGDAAVRRAVQEPERVAREFKRRVGDPAPVIVGGSPCSADGLVARLLSWMVDAVSAREGGRPSRVCLTHPASWGPYKRDLMRQAAQRAGIAPVTLLTEPEAAAACYAATERVEVGSTVAVYDLGGGTFDSAVLRKTRTGFEILGAPQGIERLGGIDFDEAILAHVRTAVGDALNKLDPEENPADLAAAVQLRAECVAAKEALSADTEAAIAVLLPGAHTTVRLTRAEFEEMIRPAIAETVTTLRRTVDSARLRPEQLDAVLLVGGSSRIPLVSQLVSAELGRPIASDISPTNAVAIGAALTVDPQPARAAARPTPVAAPVVGAARAAGAVRSRGAAPSPVARPKPSPPARPAAAARPAVAGSSSPASKPASPQRPKRPTAVMPKAAAAQLRAPVRTSSGGAVTPPVRGAASGRPANQRRWIAPTAAAVVGVLAAAALIWLTTNSGSGTSSSLGPETTTARTEAPTRATTEATTPTSTTTTPPRNTVASLIQDPCSALTSAQTAELDLRSPGRETGGGCRWEGQSSPEIDVSALSGSDLYSERINNPGGYAHVNQVEVAGRQAVRYGNPGYCSVTVRVAQNESITTGSRETSQDPNGCYKATAAAEAVLANF